MKTCTSCKSTKGDSEFHKNPNTKDGLGSQCKTCDAAGRVFKTRDKKRRLVEAFGGCCSKCGYSNSLQALHFHHADNSKEVNVSSLMKRHFEKALDEAKKCTLLCANCHAEEHEIDLASISYGGKVRGGPIPHGTVAGYKRCRPSCNECREAWRKYCSSKL